jgi:metal-sulfur cluster biosynthetic enzyme
MGVYPLNACPDKMTREVTKTEIIQALESVYDPEVGMNIVDLGLIYDVAIEAGTVGIKMTLTTPGCPLLETLTAHAQEAVKKIPGVCGVTVELVWDPPWTPERMSPAGKKRMS